MNIIKIMGNYTSLTLQIVVWRGEEGGEKGGNLEIIEAVETSECNYVVTVNNDYGVLRMAKSDLI